MVDGLGALVGGRVRLWRYDGRAPPARRRDRSGRGAGGAADGRAHDHARRHRVARARERSRRVLARSWPVRARTSCAAAAAALLPLVGALLEAERQRAFLSEELTSRYEEIDLLYAISEILGQTVRLEEATQTIVREVSTVVGARRASIMVFDESAGVLRTVAARGFGADGLTPVSVDDECSIAARVYRERRVVAYDPSQPDVVATDCGRAARLSRARRS